MKSCRQTKNQSILEHGFSVKNHLFDLTSFLEKGTPLKFSENTQLPSFTQNHNLSKLDKSKSGIYQIRNTTNNKVYIGSAFTLIERYNHHKSELNNNRHGNDHLQKSYNKYGMNNFIFEVLEYIDDISKLYDIEEVYINKYYGVNCYNIKKHTNSFKSLNESLKSKSKNFSLVDKDGVIHNFSGYTKTAKLLNLNFRLLRNLVIGKSKSYMGWRLPENVEYDFTKYRSTPNRRAKTHNVILLSPENKKYGPIFNIEEFAREHNLTSSNVRHIISGRLKSHKGWTLYKIN